MNQITLTRTNFPSNQNGVFGLRYTKKALLRAVVVAGQGPSSSNKTVASRADANMRRNAVLSSLDMSGPTLISTPEFQVAGSTDKSIKSQFVGHALCAHAAYLELNIPWLVDIENEKIMNQLGLLRRKKGQRPDFIGQDTRRRWHVFECKGRGSRPGPKDLNDWKNQTKARIRGLQISQRIVSAAYRNKRDEWKLLWFDPPAETESDQSEFDSMSFFDAYYEPLLELRESGLIPGAIPEIIPEGVLVYLPMLGAYFGLDPDIVAALEKHDPNLILAFAQERMDLSLDDIDRNRVSVFPDGVMIALPEDLNDKKTHNPKDPHEIKPKPKPEPPSPFSLIEL